MRIFIYLMMLFSVLPLCGSPVTVDRYGQYAGEEWPGKICSDEQLRADAAREAEELAESVPDSVRFDRYGGVIGGESLKATGFFRVQKLDGRWWLITPEGNRFYMKGVDAVHYGESGYYTRTVDSFGKPRREFVEGLPTQEEFPDAYREQTINFITANLRRKYGPAYQERWRDVQEKRLRAWGFNAIGKWNWPNFNYLPFLYDMKFIDLKRFGRRCLDPYDPAFETGIRNRIDLVTARFRNDPMLIGYQFENENGWGYPELDVILADTEGKIAAKRAFLELIAKRNQGDAGRIFGKPDASVETLLEEKLPAWKVPMKLRSEFLLEASRRYHSILKAYLRSKDPDHLFLAASHFDYQSAEWIAGAAEYVDVLAFNEYDFESRWIGTRLAASLRKWDRPFLVTEYSFTTTQRGYCYFRATSNAATELDRGLAFRSYVERLAANPLCVGSSYFLMYDQPATCRWKDTEAHNFGLLNVVDQPYREMISEVKKTNARLFNIHAGVLSPEETMPNMPQLTAAKKEFIPESITPLILYDHTVPEYHNGRINRLRFKNVAPLRRKLPLGTIDAGSPGGFRSVRLTFFLWSKARNQNLTDWVKLEESQDGKTFTPVGFRIVDRRECVFNEYDIVPENFKPDTRYLRINFVHNQYGATWAVSLAGVAVERR
ncbi:hypothetical protein KH017_06710 [bacterium]|nr:hypothetical protein [bacterium]